MVGPRRQDKQIPEKQAPVLNLDRILIMMDALLHRGVLAMGVTNRLCNWTRSSHHDEFPGLVESIQQGCELRGVS